MSLKHFIRNRLAAKQTQKKVSELVADIEKLKLRITDLEGDVKMWRDLYNKECGKNG